MALAGAAALAAALAAVLLIRPGGEPQSDTAWQPIAANLSRLCQQWLTPSGFVPVCMFLARLGSDNVLFDVGSPEGGRFSPEGTFSEPLLAALDRTLAGATLRWVVLTVRAALPAHVQAAVLLTTGGVPHSTGTSTTSAC